MEREFISKIDRFCNEKHIFDDVKHIVAGVSGGADSVCLLEILDNLKTKYNYTIDVVHINHCIRGKEADEDEAYVKKLCEDKNIEFYGYKIEVKKIADEKKLTEEEAGRQVRYDAFNKIASKYNEKTCIAVAHNMNDVCETMMFNLIRGTGLKGIASISPVNGNIIRPLLCVKREEIEAFLNEMKIEFKIDRTNLLEEYTRNKIRHNIIKYMDNINPKAIEHMAHAAAIAGEANGFIGEYARKTYNNIAAEVEDVKNKKIYKVYLDICKIMLENLYIQKEVIRLAIMNVCGKLKDIEETHISDIIGLMNKQSGRYVMLPYGIIAKREYNELVITQDFVNNQEIGRFKNNIYGQYIDENNSNIKNVIPDREGNFNEIISYDKNYYLPHAGMYISFSVKKLKKNELIPKNNYTKWFDCDKIYNVISIRNQMPEDYFVFNTSGNTKKLDDYYKNNKIKRDVRKTIPLITDGNHVMWILGHRTSEAYRVTENTERVLEVSVRFEE